MSIFCRGERPKIMSLSVDLDAGLNPESTFLGVLDIDAFIPASISSGTRVLSVLGDGRFAQIAWTVVGSICVAVINLHRRPTVMEDRENHMVRSIPSVIDMSL